MVSKQVICDKWLNVTSVKYKNHYHYSFNFHSGNMVLLGKSHLSKPDILTINQLSCSEIHFLDNLNRGHFNISLKHFVSFFFFPFFSITSTFYSGHLHVLTAANY